MYGDIWEILGRYWRFYGGLKSLVLSPYLHLSLIISLSSFDIWIGSEKRGADIAISVLPNLIGFSIGAFAILAQSIEKQQVLQFEFDGKKVGVVFSTSFVHTIVIQVIAVMMALLLKANIGLEVLKFIPEEYLLWVKFISLFVRALAYIFFIYGVVLILSLAFTIFRIINLIK